ncbi:MAG TPA: Tim44-like domain-containing protein [Spirochaetota bacterium]|nr:Tim44-like domain-containing protein [Spirochaetota bacterium]
MLIKRRYNIIMLLSIVLLFTAAVVFARAGGAGGESGSGGSYGGGGDDGLGTLIYIIFRLLLELPFPINVIAIAVVIGGFAAFSYISKKKIKEQTIYNQLPTGDSVMKVKGYDSFLRNNPDFDEENFRSNVKTAFLKIQEAWEKQDISGVRKFISDGVYQRFNTQFKMMQLLKQRNTLEDVTIKNIYIDQVDSDGLYDIIHVAIHASITDRFISEMDSSLNSGGKEEFVEYWSFLKKRGRPRKDIYETDNCPNCGAPLPPDMGEVSRCESCGTQTNSGEYDWVLSEITQADDYISSNPKLDKSDDLNSKIRRLVQENEDFSVQLVEDKASNGYLQIITAMAYNDPSIMRRFVSDNVFEKIQGKMTGNTVAYNRIYLNDVYLVGVSERGNMNELFIAIKSSYQRVAVDGSAVRKIDPVLMSDTEIIVMSRDKNAAASKGSIYAHMCANCGAPVENSLNLNCQYCGTALNSTSNEWIITDILSVAEYRGHVSENKSSFGYTIDPQLIDKLMDVRDFAFNNIMVVIASDGTMSSEEYQFAFDLAKKWGYNVDKIGPLFGMAMSGNLVIKMPQDDKKRAKIYKLMEKAADVDGITDEEQNLMDNIREQYGISA